MVDWFESDEFWDGFLLNSEDDYPEDTGDSTEMIEWECPVCGYYNYDFSDSLEFVCFHCESIINDASN